MRCFKLVALLTVVTITAVSATPTLARATGSSQLPGGGVSIYVSLPPIDGTEDVIAHDTVWKYGVTQPTDIGAAKYVITSMITMAGVAKFTDNNVVSFISGQAAGFLIGAIFPMSRTINIKLDRYILRGADGKTYYRVYASYYQLDGTFINSQLVQQGVQ